MAETKIDLYQISLLFLFLFSLLVFRIKELGLPREQYEWYLDLRRHGTVKHSGFSFGFDLMVLFTTGLTDVRDAIPFPRSLGKAYN